MSPKNAIKKLKSRGCRLTPARKAILSIICVSAGPLTAKELGRRLERRNIFKNKTTIYRTLSFLQKEKLVQEVSLGGASSTYESAREGHHHHLICRDCREVRDINLSRVETMLQIEMRRIARRRNFFEVEHSLELFGKCAKCSEKV